MKYLLMGFLSVILLSVQPGLCQDTLTIMKLTPAERREAIREIESAPRAYIDPAIEPRRGSFSLLNHLNYTPADRNQGNCGNCWQWACTGCIEIALDVQQNIFQRLSVQYINSCEATVIGKDCCAGGMPSDFADYYTLTGFCIPWSNANAHWQDGDGSCDTSCNSISKISNYPIVSIDDTTVETYGVGSATAIANIKNVLNQNKALVFIYWLPTASDWQNFRSFWRNQAEDDLWSPDYACGHSWVEGDGGGHGVLCVGYNDNDPSNSYWIMVNSWGTNAGRPNGIFHLDMNYDYDCLFWDPDDNKWYVVTYWQTLDVQYSHGYCPCD